MKKDDMIVDQFNILLNDFHCKLKGRQQAIDKMLATIQDSLVYRIANFPA